MSQPDPPRLPRSPSRGDELEVVIEELSLKGLGVAHFEACIGPQETPTRYRLEVRKALPGDRVIALVERRKKRVLSCHVHRYVDRTSNFVEPRCRHFGRREVAGEGCGGCTFQQLSYAGQLEHKRALVQRLFRERTLDPDCIEPILGMEDPWFYRNKMEFSFGDNHEREFALGMHPSGYWNDVLRLEECHLESQLVSELLPRVRRWCEAHSIPAYHSHSDTGFLRLLTVREGKRTGERMIELVTTPEAHVICGDRTREARELVEELAGAIQAEIEDLGGAIDSFYWTRHRAKRGTPTMLESELLSGSPHLNEEMHLPGGHILRFAIHPRAFFQPNTIQAERLYAQVLQHSGLSTRSTPTTLLDLYCGTGTIGMCLSPYVERVVGIELVPEAVENARQNAAHNGIENIEFLVGDVAEVLGTEAFASSVPEGVDLVIVDPPRSGLLPRAREHLMQIGAPRLVYVSCNPDALARDLVELESVGYRIELVQPVDMFPHTYHLENVALLELS